MVSLRVELVAVEVLELVESLTPAEAAAAIALQLDQVETAALALLSSATRLKQHE